MKAQRICFFQTDVRAAACFVSCAAETGGSEGVIFLCPSFNFKQYKTKNERAVMFIHIHIHIHIKTYVFWIILLPISGRMHTEFSPKMPCCKLILNGYIFRIRAVRQRFDFSAVPHDGRAL